MPLRNICCTFCHQWSYDYQVWDICTLGLPEVFLRSFSSLISNTFKLQELNWRSTKSILKTKFQLLEEFDEEIWKSREISWPNFSSKNYFFSSLTSLRLHQAARKVCILVMWAIVGNLNRKTSTFPHHILKTITSHYPLQHYLWSWIKYMWHILYLLALVIIKPNEWSQWRNFKYVSSPNIVFAMLYIPNYLAFFALIWM